MVAFRVLQMVKEEGEEEEAVVAQQLNAVQNMKGRRNNNKKPVFFVASSLTTDKKNPPPPWPVILFRTEGEESVPISRCKKSTNLDVPSAPPPTTGQRCFHLQTLSKAEKARKTIHLHTKFGAKPSSSSNY